MQTKVVAAGESVGYGATFVAAKETRIAIVFGGYADGLSRLLSGRGSGYCDGQRVPMIGRISMDSMVFDISRLNEVPAFIEVLNNQQTVDDLARAANTIGYEILTGLGPRYCRQYASEISPG